MLSHPLSMGSKTLEHASHTALLPEQGSLAVPAVRRFFSGLRGRLLSLTVGIVLFAGLLITPMLAVDYRNTWLREHGEAAQISALALAASPNDQVAKQLSEALLRRAQVVSVVVSGPDFREMVLEPSISIDGPIVALDLRENAGPGGVAETFGHLLAPPGRFLQIILKPSWTADQEMELIVPESALKRDLGRFTRRILAFALVLALVLGTVVYVGMYRLVVRPMKGLTDSVIRFGESPEGAEVDFQPGRSDEMQRAHEALRNMQQAVSASFRQRKRLADLGEAMAKINHDLRNSLAAAQIVSEGLGQSEDPRVRRAAPRLERALERAISLAESTLRYGRAEPPAPAIQAVEVGPVLEEAAVEALARWPGVEFSIQAEAGVRAMADPEHLHRILSNVVRNAAQVMSEQPGRNAPAVIRAVVRSTGARVEIDICDNGPGVPERMRPRLFQPFAASTSKDGTGLGLAISRELARLMRGDLELAASDESGATFRLTLPLAA